MPSTCPHCGAPARTLAQVNAAIRRLMRRARGRVLTRSEAAEYRGLLAEWTEARRAEGGQCVWVRAA